VGAVGREVDQATVISVEGHPVTDLLLGSGAALLIACRIWRSIGCTFFGAAAM
jgi:hypothetical protein